LQWQRERARTDRLFELVREEAFHDRPTRERHRIAFYVGHFEAFDWNLLGRDVLGLDAFHEDFDRLFAFGIDPVDGKLPADAPSDWPDRPAIWIPRSIASRSAILTCRFSREASS
jgi:hypothetical protein